MAVLAGLVLGTPSPGHAQPSGPYPTASHGVSFIFGAVPTAAGTIESEAGFALSEGFRSVPLLLKWTPLQLPRTEFSVGFEAFSATRVANGYDVDVADRLTFIARHHLGAPGPFAFALAPRVVVFLRDSAGIRLGATFVAAWEHGRHYVGWNLTVTGATDVSALNPRVVYTSAVDYSFSLTDRWDVFVGAQHSGATGSSGLGALEQGMAFALRPNVSIEAGLSQLDLNGLEPEVQFLASLIVNWGRLR